MFKILRRLEDPERPLLGPNIKALMLYGLILPKKGSWKRTYSLIRSIMFPILYSFLAWVDAWMVKTDMEMLIINLKETLFATIGVLKYLSYIVLKERWMSILDYVTRADLNQRAINDYSKYVMTKKYTAYCRKLTYIYWLISHTAVSVVIIQPAVRYLAVESYRENVRNGIEPFQEVARCWLPFDKTTVTGGFATWIFQTWACLLGLGMIISFDSAAVVMMVFFRLELELLRKDTADIFGTEYDPVDHDEYMRRLKDCHRRHVDLMKYYRTFDGCLSPINMLYLFLCSFSLCAGVYDIAVEENPGNIPVLVVYLVFGVFQLFIYCIHSNDVLFASQELMRGPYESTWWAHPVKYRKDLLILTMQYDQPIVFTAGPFAILDAPTFINILKAAYSYYTLIAQVGQE